MTPKPVENDMLLFDTHVAGTSHIEDIVELAEQLKVGERLDFFREPDNSYDKDAVVIMTENGDKIGYLPRKNNAIFALLMDEGKNLYGRVSRIDRRDSWVKIEMKIFLHDRT